MGRKNVSANVDQLCYAMQAFIGIVMARWAAEGPIPEIVIKEVENISEMLYNAVSPQMREYVAAITQNGQPVDSGANITNG